MKFTLEIKMGSSAMREPGDVAWALVEVQRLLMLDYDSGTILDSNGNRRGEWAFRGSP